MKNCDLSHSYVKLPEYSNHQKLVVDSCYPQFSSPVLDRPTCWAAAASPWAPPWCPALRRPRRPPSPALAPRERGGGAAGPPCGGGGGAGRYDGWMENHRKPLENGDFSWYLMAKLRKNLGKPFGKWENHRKTKGKW